MSRDPRKRFGDRLREIRKTRGLSQEQLALDSGLDRTYISGVERGRRNVSLLNIHRLAQALGIGVSALFTDEGATAGSGDAHLAR